MPNEVLAVGWSITANLGGDRQLVLQSAFATDMDAAAKNAVLDDAMKLVDRQKAVAERPGVVADLLKHREALAQFQEDFARIEAAFPAEQAAREKRLAELLDPAAAEASRQALMDQLAPELQKMSEARAAEFNSGLAEWQNAGRGGLNYTPRGHREANLKRMDHAIERARETVKDALVEHEKRRLEETQAAAEAVSGAEAERDQALQNLGISVKRYEQAIEGLQQRLADIDEKVQT